MKIRVKSPTLEARRFIGDIVWYDKDDDQWSLEHKEDVDTAMWCNGQVVRHEDTEETGKASLDLGHDLAWAGWYIVRYNNGTFRAVSPRLFEEVYEVVFEVR